MTNMDQMKDDFTITQWADIKPYLDEILEADISSGKELEELIRMSGMVYEKLEEDYAWTYIHMTTDTENEEYRKAYSNFTQNILPEYERTVHRINKKFVGSEYFDSMSDEMEQIRKKIKLSIELFREENVELRKKISEITTEYQRLVGSLTTEFRGEEYTINQMAKFLKDKDRQTRKEAYDKVVEARLSIRDNVNEIFDRLIPLRQELAKNAGFDNYRDFRFKELQRTDYSVEDCRQFHDSVKEACIPVYEKLLEEKKRMLGIDTMFPYDKAAPAESEKKLKPFEDVDEFVAKSVKVFTKVKPRFGEILADIHKSGNMDLENRKGKAPGGYNYPLLKTGMPFIFMNAVKMHSDMRTLMHEGGHGIHAVLTREQFPFYYKSTPSEVAELASMSMELLTMDHWDEFYKDEDELKQAKREQLEGIIKIFPWIALVDKFQHWVYENKDHTPQQRAEAFKDMMLQFGESFFDWSDYDEYMKNVWQKQIHIIEMPFYYIEYGIAQLGALQIWKNSKEDKKKAIEQYLNALKLGSSRSIPEIYETAGIKFDFSGENISNLMEFTFDEYSKLL
ncbi:MAG: M3 family oligoendopeptidase [candidate division WOR-3 bacterium]|nr:M3 family oligoendopeptidase [candidate division WOR-3 bacterium]